MIDEMPYDELLGWQQYFEARPYGWQDDYRTMKILSALGVKAKPESIFDSLAKLRQYANSATTTPDGQVSARNLKGSSLFAKLLNSKGGDRVECLLSK